MRYLCQPYWPPRPADRPPLLLRPAELLREGEDDELLELREVNTLVGTVRIVRLLDCLATSSRADGGD